MPSSSGAELALPGPVPSSTCCLQGYQAAGKSLYSRSRWHHAAYLQGQAYSRRAACRFHGTGAGAGCLEEGVTKVALNSHPEATAGCWVASDKPLSSPVWPCGPRVRLGWTRD